MSIQSMDYKRPASQDVIQAIANMPKESLNKDALQVILFATEGGVGCRKTAEGIAYAIKRASDKNIAMLEIITNELCMSEYFFPDSETKARIESLKNKQSSASTQ